MGVPGVNVKVKGPTPGEGQTEGNLGIKDFQQVKTGKYSCEASLSGAAEGKFSKFKVDDPRKFFSIPPRAEKVVIFNVHPPGALQIKVLRKDNQQALKDVTVHITGPDDLPGQQTPASGSIVINPIMVGKFEAKVRLPDELAGKFGTPASQTVTIQPGKSARLVFEVERVLRDLVLELDIEPKQAVAGPQPFQVALELDDPEDSIEDPVEFSFTLDEPDEQAKYVELSFELEEPDDQGNLVELVLVVDEQTDQSEEPVELEMIIDDA